MKNISVVFTLALLTISSVTYAKRSPVIECKSLCETARGEDNNACDPSGTLKFDFKAAKVSAGNLVQGGWDGDQLAEETLKQRDVQKLLTGKVKKIHGVEREGYNHGPDYISTWTLECSLK